MQISVEDYDEFIDQVFDATGDTLDIVFSAEEYDDGQFNVACDDNFAKVTLRAQDVAVLNDSSMNLCGDTVEIGNFVFDTPRIFNALFSARIKDRASIHHCAWIRAYLAEQQGLSVIHIQPDTKSVLDVSDSWLIQNRTNEGHTIWGFRTTTATKFASMTFARTAFIDNRADYVIAALAADAIDIRQCFVMIRDEKTVFLGARTKGATITFEGCTIIAPSLKQVVTQWASDAKEGDFKPVTFRNCHIYVTHEDTVPENIQLENSPIKTIPTMSNDDLAEWLQTQESSARQGKAPQLDILRDGLNLTE